MVAPLLWPVVRKAARPATKRALQAGRVAVERGREVVAEWSETASDLVAEVEAERAAEWRATMHQRTGEKEKAPLAERKEPVAAS
jgi:hypothetical protein